jgi:hypothetical protein
MTRTTTPQSRIISHLVQHGPTSSADLITYASTTPPALRALVAKGIVTRATDGTISLAR